MTSKLLKIILSVMLLITVIELGYYLLIRPNDNKFINQESLIYPTLSINPTVVANKAIHPEVIEVMKQYYYDPNTKFTFKTETTTTISDIDKDGRDYKGTFFPFAIKVTSGIDEVGSRWLYFPDFFVAKTEVYLKESNENKPISLNDLNAGDKIIMIEEYNPAYSGTDPNQLISEVIYKIK